MRGIHLQVWLGVADLPQAMPFAALYLLNGFARALALTVTPLLALETFGTAQRVSLLYFAASAAALLCSLAIPVLVHRIGRRHVVALGTALACLAALLLAQEGRFSLATGLVCYLAGFMALDIAFNLYLMDWIPRQEFGRFEPIRVLFVGAGFIAGPLGGVLLAQEWGRQAPFAAMAALAAATWALFLCLRFSDNRTIQAARRPAPSPLRFFARYFQQPRLRLAWLLAVGRSGWWAMFFVYGPIYCVEAGLGEAVAGLVASAGSASVLLCPFWGWLGRRWGIRRLLMAGYAASAVATLALVPAAAAPWAGFAVFLLAALVTSMADGAGNMLFLRAVHPHERAEMTSVFATFRDVSQIGPPGVFSLLLAVAALPAVFLAAGAGMATMALYSRFVPRQY